MEAPFAEFATVAAVFYAAEGKARVGADEVVNGDVAGFELRGEALRADPAAGEDGSAQAVARAVGDANGVGFVMCNHDRGDGAEELFVVSRHAGRDVGEHDRRVEETGAIGQRAAFEEDACAAGEAALDLGVQMIAEVGAGERADGGGRIERRADAGGFDFFDEAALEIAADGAFDDEPLRGDAALAGVDEAGLGAEIGGVIEVGVAKNQIRVAAAEFERRGFHGGARERGDGFAGAGAAGERDGGDARVGDEFGDDGGVDEDGLKEIGGNAGVVEQRGEGESAAAGGGRGFEEEGVAGHQGGRGGAKRLPEREVPRHDREDGTEWSERHAGFGGRAERAPGGEEFGGVSGVEVAAEGGFFDFGERLREGFAHFGGDELGELFASAAQRAGHEAKHAGTVAQRSGAPEFERGVRACGEVGDLFGRMFAIRGEFLAGRGVGGDERHDRMECGQTRSGKRAAVMSCQNYRLIAGARCAALNEAKV